MPNRREALKLSVEISCILGGLASFLTWIGIKPKDLAMTHPIPHIFWLLIGLALFAVSIYSSLRSGFLQKQDIKRLQEELAKSKMDSKDFARRNLEYRAQLDAPPWGGVLDPLQVEALTYAKKLGAFLNASLQSCPSREGLNKMPPAEAQKIIDEIGKWRDRLKANYNLEFAYEEEALINKFGARGIRVKYIAATRGFQPLEQRIPDTIASIVSAVHELDGVSVSAKAAE